MDWIELQKRGGIYLKEIRTGFLEYQSEIKKLSQAEALETFRQMWKETYPKQTYVDFYYYRLEYEARKKVEAVLEQEEIDYLKKTSRDGQNISIIFPMDEMLLSLTTKLNELEMLFSTIYFTGEKGKRSTWWGNYNQEYIVFTDREEI